MNKFYVVYNIHTENGKLWSGNIIISTDMKISEKLMDEINESIKEKNRKMGITGITGILIKNIIKLEE